MDNRIDEFVDRNDEYLSHDVCEPIKSLIQLENCVRNPPNWKEKIISLMPRSNFVVKNSENDCHFLQNSFQTKPRFDSRMVPRTLVCHDMKNGYLEDRFLHSKPIGNGYTFYHWAQIDIFVYFSHHFITIPPLSWINIAHNNGVQILGTLITEWTDGEKICQEIFKDTSSMVKFTNNLIEITKLFKIDGWLLNIENDIENISLFKTFVRYLTEKMHQILPGSLIIWYDSVTCDGKLDWQNELNDKNRCFFDSCDGIFLNYTWKIDNLENSLKNSRHRNLDVYVGIDVFGRNTYGGGKFNAYLAAEEIRKLNLSIAIFAQGWTHETLEKDPIHTFSERFFNRNNAFWGSLWKYLYTHPVNKLFETYFYTGVDKDSYNLHYQNIQLSKILHSNLNDSEYCDVETLLDSCKCIQLNVDETNTFCLLNKQENSVIHHLFTCDIKIYGQIFIYVITKKQFGSKLNLVILTQNLSGSFNKYICKEKQEKTYLEQENYQIEVYPCDENITRNIAHRFKNEDVNLSVFSINFEHGRILEIGAEILDETVCLCGFGMLKKHF